MCVQTRRQASNREQQLRPVFAAIDVDVYPQLRTRCDRRRVTDENIVKPAPLTDLIWDAAMDKERIRQLNDALRMTLRGGRVLMTVAVNALPDDLKALALQRTRTFADFSKDNDPHDEHDFGSFELAGKTFFWKIDYYDGSQDPSDPSRTTRVLTLMLASDY